MPRSFGADGAEGGLSVAHTESWQSVDGNPFQRIRWTYDDDVDGSNCLGLHLVEADVALQASAVLGYDEAINKYSEALDPSLKACSILGMNETDELILLQGLASFRLIQAQVLSGDEEAGSETLALLKAGQPDGAYTEVAEQWLAEYQASGDAAAACQAVFPLFEKNTDLWQITDHFGYNHPALAAQQVCYSP